MTNSNQNFTINKKILLHDFLYNSLSDIPSSSLDAKDQPKTVYIINDNDNILFSSYDEAYEEALYEYED